MTEHPNVCLQIERFPDIFTKHPLMIEFLRSVVKLPIFARESGLDV